jgi:hypothetical protein
MSKRRASAAAPDRGRQLRSARTSSRSVTSLQPRRLTHREKNLGAQTLVSHLRAIASYPHIHDVAERIDYWTAHPSGLGGRPRKHPTWALVLFGASISVFGSASEAARNLADPGLWSMVLDGARPHLRPDDIVPSSGPSRDQYQYFTKRVAGHEDALLEAFAELAAALAADVELGAAHDDWSHRPSRDCTVGMDGKVFTSPLSTLKKDRVDKRTGEIRPIRKDPARGQHREVRFPGESGHGVMRSSCRAWPRLARS